MNNNKKLIKALRYYINAKELVCEKGYYPEIFLQDTISYETITLEYYYREYAWVVLSSGLSEKVVLKIFPAIEEIFLNWRNLGKIVSQRSKIEKKALAIFSNRKKINALIEMALYLNTSNISVEVNNIKLNGLEYLQSFKFLGPATSNHFAKNIGFNFAKPDRHLIRIASKLGYSCVNTLCESISLVVGEKKSVIDIVLWRYATLNRNYI
jgi:hypothetical protein